MRLFYPIAAIIGLCARVSLSAPLANTVDPTLPLSVWAKGSLTYLQNAEPSGPLATKYVEGIKDILRRLLVQEKKAVVEKTARHAEVGVTPQSPKLYGSVDSTSLVEQTESPGELLVWVETSLIYLEAVCVSVGNNLETLSQYVEEIKVLLAAIVVVETKQSEKHNLQDPEEEVQRRKN